MTAKVSPAKPWRYDPTQIAELSVKALSIIAGVAAAILWFMSASVPIPNAPGAAIGSTLATDPFNVAMRLSAHLNQYAAVATGLSVGLLAIAEGIAIAASWPHSSPGE
jgi:hypothetical protein